MMKVLGLPVIAWIVVIIIAVVLIAFYVMNSKKSDTTTAKATDKNWYSMTDMMIYYGAPSKVNKAVSVTDAATTFSQYGILVLAMPDNKDEVARTMSVIQDIRNLNKSGLIFGYIDLGIKSTIDQTPRSNYTDTQLFDQITQWKAMGVNGIFWDNAGYDYMVTRVRQNTVVDKCHSMSLICMMNVWNIDDVAGVSEDKIPHRLNNTDWVLLEFTPANKGTWMEWSTLKDRIQKAKVHQKSCGLNIAISSTFDVNKMNANQLQFIKDYLGALCLTCGFQAVALCSTNYSAIDNHTILGLLSSFDQSNTIFTGAWNGMLSTTPFDPLQNLVFSDLEKTIETTVADKKYKVVYNLNNGTGSLGAAVPNFSQIQAIPMT